MSWGDPQTLQEKIIVTVMAPLSTVYGAFAYLHKLAYQKKFLPQNKLSCPVISVGNITVGGTGKTPIIISLANQLLAHNLKVGILSRGYKRKNNKSITVVCDGQGKYASLEDSGDEPLMLAKILSKAVVIAGQNRFLAGQKAISEYACDVILLDDAFQHWKLQRDYDIVLLDYNDELLNDNLLPAGRLREPLNALERAQHIIITKIPKNYDQQKIDRLKHFIVKKSPNSSVSLCHFESESLHQLIAGKWADEPLDKLKGLPMVAFCGLAKNQGFFNMIEDLGAKVLNKISFGDHHNYTNADIENLKKALKSANAEYLVTTRKDLIKLENSPLSSRIIAINMSVEWVDEMPDLSNLVKNK